MVPPVILNRIIVHTKEAYHRTVSDRIAARHDATIVAEFPNMDAFLIETTTGTIEALEATLDQLSNDPDVDAAFPDGFITTTQDPTPETAQMIIALNNNNQNDADAYAEVRLPEAWEVLNGQTEDIYTHVNVAVLDAGMYGDQCGLDFINATNMQDILEHEFPHTEALGDSLSPVLIHKQSCSNKLDDIAHGISVVSILAAANNSGPRRGGDERFSGILASIFDLQYHVLVYDIRPVVFYLFGKEYEWKKLLEVMEDRFEKELLPGNVRDQLQKAKLYSALNKITKSRIKVLNISAGCDPITGDCISPNPPKGNRGGGQRRDEGPGIGLAGT